MDQLLYYKMKDASSSFNSRYFISLASNHITRRGGAAGDCELHMNRHLPLTIQSRAGS